MDISIQYMRWKARMTKQIGRLNHRPNHTKAVTIRPVIIMSKSSEPRGSQRA